jgi:hypothetical protein
MGHLDLKNWTKEQVNGARLFRALSDSHARRRDRLARHRTKEKKALRWWLVYGAARTGTTYMVNLMAQRSQFKVSDWCLSNILKLTPPFDYIRFDRRRALKDISDNILDNAARGPNQDLDLAFKQCQLEYPEYERLVEMWGRPDRIIFCFRQPAGCISSSEKHFVGELYIPIPRLQERYIQQFETYKKIGGDPFEYGPHCTLDTYLHFLDPLRIDASRCKPFLYKGEDQDELTTHEMWQAFREFKEQHSHVPSSEFT